MAQPDAGEAVGNFVASYNKTLSEVSVRAVGVQVALMASISVVVVLLFSFFRPREKKVYAPKIKYQAPAPVNPADNPDYEPPPPPISNGFFAWLSPVVRIREEQMIANIGLDATTFLRFLRMLRMIFSVMVLGCVGLIVLYVIYNLRNVDARDRNALSLLTVQSVTGNWVWPSLAAAYVFNIIVMFFVWRNWQTMILLRSRWFRSAAYQSKIYSRTLMVTQVRKDFRSDQGLLSLMGQLKVDGIKIGPEIDCTCIGRRLDDFPEMVEDHNQAVKDLESHLVKYLKHGKISDKRPTMRVGAFMGMGGKKVDAIDHLSQQIKFLRDKIDEKRRAVDSLLRQQRKARKGGKPATRVEGENYGFVTFKTIAEAHRIARAHRGRLKELHGAELHLAPPPKDIIWENIKKEPGEVASRRLMGFVFIGAVCFLNTIPLLVVSTLANLSALTVYVPFLREWQTASAFGNWSFSVISGVLPSVVSALFGYFLPIILRRISKYQGAPTRSRLERAVSARYFFFIILSNLFIFSLLGVIYSSIAAVVAQIGERRSAIEILRGLQDIPHRIQGTYVQQSTYWLTWLPLRGFLVIFEIIQLIKLALVSLRRFMFSHTPREIRDMTKPPNFEYAIVMVNLLWVCAVGMIYAPLAPLVAIGACLVFWFSSIIYKYQLLYVYTSRAESGGRMWNVYCNRLLACCVFMQLLMVLTVGLSRGRWLDCVAAAPAVLMLLIFKIYMSRTSEARFRYYVPTPDEIDQGRVANEKRTHHSEMEKRFLHPALQQDKLYQIMVHKSQEDLARQVLAAYPWFAGKHEHQGVEIKAIGEDNLEYDPNRVKKEDNWETRSIASTDMLGGAKSELNTPGGDDMYKSWPGQGDYAHYPLANQDSPLGARADLPYNPSTDHLIPGATPNGRSDDYAPLAPRRQNSRPYPSRMATSESISGAPLLDDVQPVPLSPQPSGPGGVPYPPTAYNQPPVGYTPPTMRRTATDMSNGSDVGSTRWDAGQGTSVAGYGHGYGYAGSDAGDPESGYRYDPYAAPQSTQHTFAYSQPQSTQHSSGANTPPRYATATPSGHARGGNGNGIEGNGMGSGGSSRAPNSRSGTPGYDEPYDPYRGRY